MRTNQKVGGVRGSVSALWVQASLLESLQVDLGRLIEVEWLRIEWEA